MRIVSKVLEIVEILLKIKTFGGEKLTQINPADDAIPAIYCQSGKYT